MESADHVRASLAVASLGDLRRHEATSRDGESAVASLLGAARVLSWPLVVDPASGLLLDGSHRTVVLARDFGARFAVVQRVALDAPDVWVGTWCHVLEGVSAAAFEAARHTLGLEAGVREGLRCHYAGRVYVRPAPVGSDAHDPVSEVLGALSPNGHPPPVRLVEDDAAGRWLAAPDVVVVRPPALDKDTVRRRTDGPLLQPKSTRFLLPFRVFGLAIPLAALAGPRKALQAELDRQRARPLACLDAGLDVDRRYPARLWQFTDHRIPQRRFPAAACPPRGAGGRPPPGHRRPAARATGKGAPRAQHNVRARRKGSPGPLVKHPGAPPGAAPAGDPSRHTSADRPAGSRPTVPDGD